MTELSKRTEEYIVDTEEEAKALIQKIKDDDEGRGYEVVAKNP